MNFGRRTRKKMQKVIKYAVFKTKWGYFGLAGTEFGLCRTCLPGSKRQRVKSHLLRNLRTTEYDKTLFKTVQEQITAYFKGTCVNFSPDIPIVLDGFSEFTGLVLAACRKIGLGKTISYGRLAKVIGRPTAARAVGACIAKNPLPLIIPCHRVIRSDGKIGGFSAAGGVTLKKKMLLHEQKTAARINEKISPEKHKNRL